MNEKSALQSASEPPKQKPDKLDQPKTDPPSLIKTWESIWVRLQHSGRGENFIRIGSALVCLVLVVAVLWVMRSFYLKGTVIKGETNSALAQPNDTNNNTMLLPEYAGSSPVVGINRANQSHTDLPSQSRFEVQQYTVQAGDSLFIIAQKYNLDPTTLLFGNQALLNDNPDRLIVGDVLNILPVDGALYQWNKDDSLIKVATYFRVAPQDIINWPGNNLTAESVGDLSKPNIPVGTKLVIPGGKRDFISWSAPQIRRDNPAVAKVLGKGFCGPQTAGPIGNGVFWWPTVERRISGYDFSPQTNHPAIDIGGKLGNPIYSMEAGVVVYAGWNDWGYGNLIVIDHGDGYQSMYAHLSKFNVSCGDFISNGGETIGWMGSTGNSSGPHLHFEITFNGSPVNPHKLNLQ